MRKTKRQMRKKQGMILSISIPPRIKKHPKRQKHIPDTIDAAGQFEIRVNS